MWGKFGKTEVRSGDIKLQDLLLSRFLGITVIKDSPVLQVVVASVTMQGGEGGPVGSQHPQHLGSFVFIVNLTRFRIT